jgi:hypothetical protein
MTASDLVLATQEPGNVTGHITSLRAPRVRRAHMLRDMLSCASHPSACRAPPREAAATSSSRANGRRARSPAPVWRLRGGEPPSAAERAYSSDFLLRALILSSSPPASSAAPTIANTPSSAPVKGSVPDDFVVSSGDAVD